MKPTTISILRHLRYSILSIVILIWLFSGLGLAQDRSRSPDRLWQSLDLDSTLVRMNQLSSLTWVPKSFRPFRLDRSQFEKLMQRRQSTLTATTSCNDVVITLPKPNANNAWLRFCVKEIPMMEPELAAQFPAIKAYEGQGIDDPSMTARLDWTATGLHAIVLSPGETFFIDPLPVRRGDLSTYMSYLATDSQQRPFQCFVESDAAASRASLEESARTTPVISNGDTLRTYRLAVAATGEYTAFHGGTVASAFNAIFTTVNRVSAIYKRELAIQFVLVRDQSRIIYTEAATDPYSNNDARLLLSENQRILDGVIGSANYDIGHVFGTGGGGLASVGVVGINGSKARGETGSREPRGDPFDVDFVAHEIGHQFGANHTFNGTTGNCGGRNRNNATAFEPGSGSTIMAYAGICGEEDLQKHSDDVFHIVSLLEIISFINREDVRSVPVMTPTENHSPIIEEAGASFHIPKQTPFVLTARADDPNGDKLSFSWEEIDLGREGPPNDDNQDVRPIFRSFKPDTTGSRIFPRLSDLLNGGPSFGEVLPARNRTLNFRVTVRDNRSGGGAFSSRTEQVSISDNGSFAITQPTRMSVWAPGSTQRVTWDVAGTSAAPINCLNVRISISTDGGKSFTTLTESTPNNGEAVIVVPNTPTTMARIRVEAIANIFFSLSPGNFRIASTTQ